MTTPVTAEHRLVFTKPTLHPPISLKMGDDFSPAVVQYERTLRPMNVGTAVPLFEKGVMLSSASSGAADLKVFYDGEEPVPVVIIRGEGEIVQRGWREEEVEHLVRFHGHASVALDSPTPPTTLFQTNFCDSQGKPVTPPLYYPAGKHGELRHGQPVYGSMILRFTRSYQSYRLIYPINDFFLTCDDKGHVQQAGGSGLSPVVVTTMTPFAFAMLRVPRRVALQDVTPRLREGNRVEVGRRGVIDRVFPTPPFQQGTPPTDPRTGRNDYMDIERTTALFYKADLHDENGRVESTVFHRENLENKAPVNSYVLRSFNRNLEN